MTDPRPLAEISPASPWCQRWSAGAHSWRHVSEGGFDQADYEVRPIDELVAKEYVLGNHYSRSYPAASRRYGLFTDDRLVGTAVFGIPVQAKVLSNVFPGIEPYTESLELSRFVLDDECPGNSESWFLARCFDELAAGGIRGIVSFADPVRRLTPAGTLLCPGHVGVIYQASNAIYTGRGTARTLTILRDGTLNDRSQQKVRRQERGHEHVELRLIELGARVMRTGENPAEWLAQAIEDVGAEKVRHGGNHRYAFQLGRNRRERSQVVVGLPSLTPYPKAATELVAA